MLGLAGVRRAAGVALQLRAAFSAAAAQAGAAASAAAAPVPPPLSASASAAASPAAAAAAAGSAPVAAARTGHFGQRFEVGVIRAVRRDASGKRTAQWARMHGLIPGIVYGTGPARDQSVVQVFVAEAELRAEVNRRRDAFTNTQYDLLVDGERHRVIPRDFQLHPFRPKIISCNWLRYKPGRFPGVKVDIPLRAFNEERCPAYKDGGWLLEIMYKLRVYAHGDEIPDAIMMDLRGKRIGDRILASELQLPEGVSLRTRGEDYAVAKFVGSRRGAATAAATDAKDEKKPAAKPAAGGAAAPAAAGGAAAAAKPAAK